MGRRLRLLWQLGGQAEPGPPAEPGPDIVVAPIKAVLQRLGPWRTAARPVVVAKGDRVDVDELVARAGGHGLPARVDRRAPRRAGRPGRHRRRVPVHRRRAGPDRPVGRRGRPAHPVRRRRPAVDRRPRSGSSCSAAASWWPTRPCGSGPPSWSGRPPWGRHQWDRLADGEQFDGMESWLPWLADGEELVCDLLGDDALVVLVEPRRVRDRAGELLDEEAALADALASTWGLEAGRRRPAAARALRPPARPTPRPAWSPWCPTAEGPDIPLVECRGWEPILGDGAKLAAQVPAWSTTGTRWCSARRPPGAPSGCPASWPRRS